MKARRPPKVCPVCGEDVPPKSKSCPECGACHESGWKLDGEPDYGALDLPDWAYEDDEEKIVRPLMRRPRASGSRLWLWRCVGAGLILWWLYWLTSHKLQWW